MSLISYISTKDSQNTPREDNSNKDEDEMSDVSINTCNQLFNTSLGQGHLFKSQQYSNTEDSVNNITESTSTKSAETDNTTDEATEKRISAPDEHTIKTHL